MRIKINHHITLDAYNFYAVELLETLENKNSNWQEIAPKIEKIESMLKEIYQNLQQRKIARITHYKTTSKKIMPLSENQEGPECDTPENEGTEHDKQ